MLPSIKGNIKDIHLQAAHQTKKTRLMPMWTNACIPIAFAHLEC